MNSDIRIAQEATMMPIDQIASQLNLTKEEWEPYGHYKAKISLSVMERLHAVEEGKVILITSINPTPAGEGKSTVTVGLGQAMNKIGKKAIIALREPSLGPTMGIKGGAAGGGYSQVVPMEEINLHFTGDFHAITTAHNALAAFIDNHIHQGNQLRIDPRRVVWKRVVDLNDRALRQIVVGLGGPIQGVPRESGFDITVASEIMAILCLASDLKDLKKRLANIVVAYTFDEEPITVSNLGVQGALTLLLKEALKPNLVQTLENTPALIHGGPFANIAHGCNSIIATKMGMKLADYVVTEAGFGADLGAEKFLNIKAQIGRFKPSAVVIVVTMRALKMHGGVEKTELASENIDALREGMTNLQKHIETLESFGVPYVVAINKFATDFVEEIDTVIDWCEKKGIKVSVADVWGQGGTGATDLAAKVVDIIDTTENNYKPLYKTTDTLEQKIQAIASTVYGASGVDLSSKALKQLQQYAKHGWDHLPICMAKTQYSLSDNPKLLGRPEDFVITVREFRHSIGAGFIVALTGDVMTMPGLPKHPAALNMDVNEEGQAIGLF